MDKDRPKVEGRIFAVLSKYAGKRIVGGQVMDKLLQDLTEEYLKMEKEHANSNS